MPTAPSSTRRYDPHALGAACHVCLLGGPGGPQADPVPPETKAGAEIALVGEAPGIREEEAGKPFAGQSGIEEERALRAAGLTRARVSLFNALACRPASVIGGQDSGSLQRLDAALHARNRRRRVAGKQPLPHPIECCRPRLLAELNGAMDPPEQAAAGYDRIISLGGAAVYALTGERKSILDLRGGPMTLRRLAPAPAESWVVEPADDEALAATLARLPARKLLPTVHPAFVSRAGAWRFAFHEDHRRALRHFAGTLSWRDPEIVEQPSVQQLAAFLGVERDPDGSPPGGRAPGRCNGLRAVSSAARLSIQAYDFETDGVETMTAQVRCIGIGGGGRVLVVQLLSRDGHTRFYTAAAEARIKDILYCWATGPRPKAGWNCLSFDGQKFQQWMGLDALPARQLDGIFFALELAPELPRGLAFWGSVYTDVHRWKAGKEAVDDARRMKLMGPEDGRLRRYNALDVEVTHQVVVGKMLPAIRRNGLEATYRFDARRQAVGRTMKRVGMLVDQQERARLQAHYEKQAKERGERCRRIADDPGLNLNSPAQIADLLYSKSGFDLEPMAFSEITGQPSTADNALRALLRATGQLAIPDEARDWILSYRRFRKAEKLVGTFIRPAMPVVDGTAREQAAREKKALALTDLDRVRKLLPLAGSQAFLRVAENAVQAGDSDAFQVTADDRRGLSRALYDVWNLPPVRTLKGNPTVARDALLTLWRAKPGPLPRAFLQALFDFFISAAEALRLASPPESDEEDSCFLLADGRVHPDWKSYLVVSGRDASSPNLQNCSVRIRSMYVPGLGHLFVYADMDQLELRVAASRWSAMTGIRSTYLDAFATVKEEAGKRYRMDPHQVSMARILGDDCWSWPGAPPRAWRFYKEWPGGEIGAFFDQQRTFIKRLVYLGIYAGEAETAHEVLTSVEDDAGNLIYQDKSVKEVRAALESWRANSPEFEAGWSAEMEALDRDGVQVDPISGRKQWFRSERKLQEVVNRPIQTAGASLVALGLIAFDDLYPEGHAGPYTGVNNLCHDAILAETSEVLAGKAAEDLTACMTRTHPSLPGVDFPAKGTVKRRWQEPKTRKGAVGAAGAAGAARAAG